MPTPTQQWIQWIFQILITLLLFSIWAAFALLIVNPYLQADLPGYRIGRICIWEYIALVIAAIISHFIIKKWGNLELRQIDQQQKLVMHPNYGIVFLIYFILAIMISIWQFWLFSQQF